MASLMIKDDGKDGESDAGDRQEHRRLPPDRVECCKRGIGSIAGGNFDLGSQRAPHQKQLRHTWTIIFPAETYATSFGILL